jgi:hypothetical protein
MHRKGIGVIVNISRSKIVMGLIIAAMAVSTASHSICESILASIAEKDQASTQAYLSQLEEDKHFPCLLELYPRYFWAQNMSHILVKFEFLNSADTSACERVLSSNKQVEHNTISLSLVCLQSNLLIRYRISVTTFMPLNFYHAVWKEA